MARLCVREKSVLVGGRKRFLLRVLLGVLALLVLVGITSMYRSLLWVSPDGVRIGVARGVVFCGVGDFLVAMSLDTPLRGIGDDLPSGWHARSYQGAWRPPGIWSCLEPPRWAPLVWWPGWLERPSPAVMLSAPGLGSWCARPASWLYAIPLWMPMLITAGVLCGAVVTARHARRAGVCAHCGYNLTGNISGICPECGTPVPEEQRRSESP